MTHQPIQSDPSLRSTESDLSLFGFLVLLVRSRAVLSGGMVLGLSLAIASVLFAGKTYTATASFVPGLSGDGRGDMGGLAGQLGLAVPGLSSPNRTSEFYAELLVSRELLGPIALARFDVMGDGSGALPLYTLYEIEASSESSARDRAVRLLAREALDIQVDASTGIVRLEVTTPWPEVSVGVTQALLVALNDFNLRKRQAEAAEERRFTEERMRAAAGALRDAEDRLQRFLQGNREYRDSPQLTFQYERLEREVALRQQVYGSLLQAYEDVRIREMRDVPVVTVIEQPAVLTDGQSANWAVRAAAGLMLGLTVAMILALVGHVLQVRRSFGDKDAEAFGEMLDQVVAQAKRAVHKSN